MGEGERGREQIGRGRGREGESRKGEGGRERETSDLPIASLHRRAALKTSHHFSKLLPSADPFQRFTTVFALLPTATLSAMLSRQRWSADTSCEWRKRLTTF